MDYFQEHCSGFVPPTVALLRARHTSLILLSFEQNPGRVYVINTDIQFCIMYICTHKKKAPEDILKKIRQKKSKRMNEQPPLLVFLLFVLYI